MITLTGKGACAGVAFGPVFVFSRAESMVKRRHIESSDAETERFEAARRQAIGELDELYERAVSEVGEANAMIFQIHQMMIEDVDYIESVKNIITDQLLNAETAVAQTCDSFAQMFEAMEDSYMSGRSADVRDVSERVIRILSGASGGSISPDKPSVIAADDLAPSETVQIDKSKIYAFVTEEGSANSHTSILARMMNIPAVVCAKGILKEEYNGRDAIVDGFTGSVYIDPDKETIAKMKEKLRLAEEKRELLLKLRGKASLTKDGRKLGIYANINSVSDIGALLANDAEGIGLFRSEFLYLEEGDYPSEESQFEVYKEILSKMEGKRVCIRTLDIGADKRADYFDLPEEKNPAMGMRAVRLCLKRPEILKTQLRALYRASVYGNLAVMFPMIASEWEIIKVKKIIDRVKNELKNEGREYSETVEIGCMIETPAAVLISDILAKHVDFFSIGTNDLTQYMLAADRHSSDMSEFYDERHAAVLRSVAITAKNAAKNGVWVGICGEIAADTELTGLFLAMGINSVSVAPEAVLPIRQKVLDTDVSKIKEEELSRIIG